MFQTRTAKFHFMYFFRRFGLVSPNLGVAIPNDSQALVPNLGIVIPCSGHWIPNLGIAIPNL